MSACQNFTTLSIALSREQCQETALVDSCSNTASVWDRGKPGRGHQSPENHWSDGECPGIWGQKMSVNPTPLERSITFGSPEIRHPKPVWDNFRVPRYPPGITARGRLRNGAHARVQTHEEASASDTLDRRCSASGICRAQRSAKRCRNASCKLGSFSTSFRRVFQHKDNASVKRGPSS